MNQRKSTYMLKRIRYLTLEQSRTIKHGILRDDDEVSFLPMESICEQGEIDLSVTRRADEVSSGYTPITNGDVIVPKITPCFENGKGALVNGLIGGVGFATTELHVLTPGPDLDGRFLYYITVDPRFRKQGEAHMFGAAGQQRVPAEFVRDYRVTVPPLSQQRTIVRYLDRETAKLDALVTEKQRLVKVLVEKRRAVVARIITRGNFPLTRMKHVVSLRRSRVDGAGDGVPYVGLEDVESWTGKLLSGDLTTNENGAPSAVGAAPLSTSFEAGDVLFGKLRPYLAKAWVAEFAGRCSTELLVMEPVGITADFLRYVCLSHEFVRTVDASTFGSKMPRADWDTIGNLRVPVPPKAEQQEIVMKIVLRIRAIDDLSKEAERTIVLLKERRASLISEAIVGMIDVDGVP